MCTFWAKFSQRFLLIKNVGKIKNVKKRVFYSKNKKRKKRFSQLCFTSSITGNGDNNASKTR